MQQNPPEISVEAAADFWTIRALFFCSSQARLGLSGAVFTRYYLTNIFDSLGRVFFTCRQLVSVVQ